MEPGDGQRFLLVYGAIAVSSWFSWAVMPSTDTAFIFCAGLWCAGWAILLAKDAGGIRGEEKTTIITFILCALFCFAGAFYFANCYW